MCVNVKSSRASCAWVHGRVGHVEWACVVRASSLLMASQYLVRGIPSPRTLLEVLARTFLSANQKASWYTRRSDGNACSSLLKSLRVLPPLDSPLSSAETPSFSQHLLFLHIYTYIHKKKWKKRTRNEYARKARLSKSTVHESDAKSTTFSSHID